MPSVGTRTAAGFIIAVSMVTIFVYQHGHSTRAERVDPTWLLPDSDVVFWLDLFEPTQEDAGLLRDTFHFHDLAIEDAVSDVQYPKIEAYDDYLYVVLHGINFVASQHQFATHDTDFFVGRNYLVTVHINTARTIDELQEVCTHNPRVLSEGSVALLHRIVDGMVDHYRPEVAKLEGKLDLLERAVFEHPRKDLIRWILGIKRDIASLRRVALPQRDVVGRLARREFAVVDTEIAYRFRDVHDHLVRLTDEAMLFHDRVTGILEAHLSNVSNRLNQVMKVLTVISTIFMPLTLLTGVYGMNIPFPPFPGGEHAQFWWLFGLMLGSTGLMLLLFRWRRWI